jgi:hypothetical protein
MKSLWVLTFLIILITSSGCAVNEQYLVEDKTKTVVADGYGTSEEDSLKSALLEASIEAFGMKVDTAEASVNGRLTYDQTSTTDEDPVAFIKGVTVKNYKILEKSSKNGQYYTKVKAEIQRERKFEFTPNEQRNRRLYNNAVSLRTDVSSDPYPMALEFFINLFTGGPIPKE